MSSIVHHAALTLPTVRMLGRLDGTVEAVSGGPVFAPTGLLIKTIGKRTGTRRAYFLVFFFRSRLP
ncbi:hypothetical protein GCM10023148_32550 [Actinokineospora soli]